MRDLYRTAQWRRLRLRVLDRDGWECRLRFPGCAGRANSADHIVEVEAEGGAFWDESNIQAACVSCNSKKHMAVLTRRARVRRRAW